MNDSGQPENRDSLLAWLEGVADSSIEEQDVRKWITIQIVGDDQDLLASYSPLLLEVVFALDRASTEPELRGVARELHILLSNKISDRACIELLPLATERSQVESMIAKASRGKVSRSTLEAFFSRLVPKLTTRAPRSLDAKVAAVESRQYHLLDMPS